jgi:hypothetical protein
MGLFGQTNEANPGADAPASSATAAPASVAGSLPGHLTPEALRLAELLSISPDMLNVTVNVGFNTKLAVEEILE